MRRSLDLALDVQADELAELRQDMAEASAWMRAEIKRRKSSWRFCVLFCLLLIVHDV